jgi:hypothetical protein
MSCLDECFQPLILADPIEARSPEEEAWMNVKGFVFFAAAGLRWDKSKENSARDNVPHRDLCPCEENYAQGLSWTLGFRVTPNQGAEEYDKVKWYVHHDRPKTLKKIATIIQYHDLSQKRCKREPRLIHCHTHSLNHP